MAAEFDAFDASSWEWQSSTRTIVTSYGRERARPEAITRRIRHRQRFRRLRVGIHTYTPLRLGGCKACSVSPSEGQAWSFESVKLTCRRSWDAEADQGR